MERFTQMRKGTIIKIGVKRVGGRISYQQGEYLGRDKFRITMETKLAEGGSPVSKINVKAITAVEVVPDTLPAVKGVSIDKRNRLIYLDGPNIRLSQYRLILPNQKLYKVDSRLSSIETYQMVLPFIEQGAVLYSVLKSGQPRPYADSELLMHMWTNKNKEELKVWLTKNFKLGDKWYEPALSSLIVRDGMYEVSIVTAYTD